MVTLWIAFFVFVVAVIAVKEYAEKHVYSKATLLYPTAFYLNTPKWVQIYHNYIYTICIAVAIIAFIVLVCFTT